MYNYSANSWADRPDGNKDPVAAKRDAVRLCSGILFSIGIYRCQYALWDTRATGFIVGVPKDGEFYECSEPDPGYWMFMGFELPAKGCSPR